MAETRRMGARLDAVALLRARGVRRLDVVPIPMVPKLEMSLSIVGLRIALERARADLAADLRVARLARLGAVRVVLVLGMPSSSV